MHASSSLAAPPEALPAQLSSGLSCPRSSPASGVPLSCKRPVQVQRPACSLRCCRADENWKLRKALADQGRGLKALLRAQGHSVPSMLIPPLNKSG
eukprot:scaffold185761_cov31-Tisochrysis_lutea.AAC.1